MEELSPQLLLGLQEAREVFGTMGLDVVVTDISKRAVHIDTRAAAGVAKGLITQLMDTLGMVGFAVTWWEPLDLIIRWPQDE